LDEKQYIGTHVIGKTITGFKVRKGQAQITVDDEEKGEGVLSIGARSNSVTLCFQGEGVQIEE